jgi:hypothetical protein
VTGNEGPGEYERRFRRAGLPLLIEDFSASTNVFNRAAPLLALVFLGEMLGAVSLDWSLVANVAAAIGGLAILLVAAAAVNRFRGRALLAVPEDVGRVELAAFVVLPALLPLVFGGQWRSAVVTAAANLALLALIYAVVGYGLVSILRWALTRLLSQLASSLALLTRAIPLLMIFSVVLFLTTEMWQVFSDAAPASLGILAALLVALGTSFLVARLPREVRSLEREAGGEGPELDRRQRLNVGLVLFVSQSLQVLLVSLAVGAFFVALGMLVIDADVLRSWIGTGGHVLITIHLLGHDGILTEELLRVSGAIAAFTGLYFAISMLTDDVYRREFLDELTGEMRDTFRARAEYLRLRAGARADTIRAS